MKARIIQIGNSQGIRLPKTTIEQLGFQGEVYLEIKGRELIIRSRSAPRAGWEDAFALMAKEKDDKLEDHQAPGTDWEETEWEW